MSINRVDFGVIAASSEISNIKAAEDARPLTNQQSFQTQFNEEVIDQQHSVNAKDDISQGEMHANAQDKGSNEYYGDGGKNRRNGKDSKAEALERHLTLEQMEKMAESMHDKHGKPIDLRISSGFDLKI